MENHFYPFFWQHGEDKIVLEKYVNKISESGMKGLCIESRPHPDFIEEGWWKDLEIILETCQAKDMEAWILDDSHFPTGYANGRIKSDYPKYLKQYINYRRFDVVGPFDGARIDASQLKGRPWEQEKADVIEVLGVFLVERSFDDNINGDAIDFSTISNITKNYYDDTIYVNIPRGDWSVFVVYSTHLGEEETTKDYLNPLDSKATKILIEEVYEPHYKNVGKFFGNVITAFFSDEPRFGNTKGTNAQIGTEQPLPWKPSLEQEFNFEMEQLILLWVNDKNSAEKEIRYQYMDTITTMYNENFTKVLAEWCHAHGIEYLGHNIEDNGAHSRLGYGTGHYFRGQEAQDYAGIDIIGGQIVPGMPYHHDAYQTGGSDGQFYHYALAKLAASAAHLYPHKQGRAMCEAYGAYGWNEGLKTMKWITDHLLVRGINFIVPHAFSPKEFPDSDCPPHFYAHGNNPQYRYLYNLVNYANRIMSLLSNGKHVAPIAVAYPAELEWTGSKMQIELVTRKLTENQIDMDIVPFDLLESAVIVDGKMKINDEIFETLVIPEAEYLPKEIVGILNRLIESGLNVMLLNQPPLNHYLLSEDFKTVPLEQLPHELSEYLDIELDTKAPSLVYYHYTKDNKDYYLFFNESFQDEVSTDIIFYKTKGNPISYNPYVEAYYEVINNRLELKPFETIIWIFGADTDSVEKRQVVRSATTIDTKWHLSYSSALDYPNFGYVTSSNQIIPLNRIEGFERVSGTVAYEATITLNTSEVEKIIGIDLGNAYEIAELFINGISKGQKISPPYIFNAGEAFVPGNNILRIEITNTLGTQFRGQLNQYLLIEPFGLMNNLRLLFK